MLNNESNKTKNIIELLNIFEITKLTKKQNDINDKFAGINKKLLGITNSRDGTIKPI